jgi:hypothetical protein
MRGRNSKRPSRSSVLGCALGIAFAAAIASPASAKITIGSADPFGPSPTSGLVSCATPPCSYSQAALPGRPVISPVNGVIQRWSVRWGTTPDTAVLRVMDPFGGEVLFTASSPPVNIVADKQSFPASIQIGFGDRIAVDDLNPGSGGSPQGTVDPVPGAVIDTWLDSPPDGDFASPTVSNNPPDTELLLNAEIEPFNDIRLDSIMKQRKKGTAIAYVTVRNRGTLEVSSKFVKPMTLQGGLLRVLLKPTKKTRKKLKRTGKALGPATFTFTPIFGTPNAQVFQIPLRLKRKK